MSEKLRELGQKIQEKLNNEQSRRRWQAIIGVTFMVVFVVTSIVANRTVLALNQAAGNYGYYGGTYGYAASVTSSDYLPSAPTVLSASTTSTTATISWTAPTLTTGGTAIDVAIASYDIHYCTSSLSSCSGGTETSSTSASKSLSDLSVNTTYYIAVCAVDNNGNASGALTSSFTTANTSSGASGGGGGGTAASVFGVITPVPITTITTPGAVVVGNVGTFLTLITRNSAAETVATSAYITPVLGSVSSDVATKLIAYIKYGYGLGASVNARGGEREVAGIVNDLAAVIGAEKTKESVLNDKFFKVAEAALLGEGIKTTKAVRDIDYAAAFGLEKKLLPAFWTLTGIKPTEIAAAKGTAKYENFWEGFSKAVYAVRLAKRDLVAERKAIRFVQQRMVVVNRELAKQKVKTITTKSPIFWNLVRAVITIDQTNVKNLF